MKRRCVAILTGGVVFLFCMIGIATATPIAGEDYFKAQSIFFHLQGEDAGYEADFGMFDMFDANNRFLVFSYNQEPGPLTVQYITQDLWAPLKTGFGFYFGVHTGGKTDLSTDYLFFTDASLNRYASGIPIDTNIEHISVNFISTNYARILLDDQIGGGDRDWNDMQVGALSSAIAPVPEPATLLLFGTGLVGLIGAKGRRKKDV